MLYEISQSQKDKYHAFFYMQNLILRKKKHENIRVSTVDGGQMEEERGQERVMWELIKSKHKI
jgi:hypothetical protein